MLNLAVPSVVVHTTQGRGHTPEEVAARLVDRIVAVADTAPEPIRDQARAFRAALVPLCAGYMQAAVRSDRTTLANRLREAGMADAADAVMRL
ncbi:hypothetical protein UFOVP421_40 [uncultured Caudovirales phage]|uniref:Uncharacterized protein n=1 Tax=uncultured Caudovirales phage TaxID=2100421 RepID=A0A6J5MDW7_9CAUD|nr:hypothetical protein UFOVP421_40 [uncultured Caudovirales phage]